jgi:hypothetical protein
VTLEFGRRVLVGASCRRSTVFSGRPSRAAAVDELVRAISAKDGVWVATGSEIAGYVESLGLPSRYHPPITFPLEAG